jgi:hypothetical protein
MSDEKESVSKLLHYTKPFTMTVGYSTELTLWGGDISKKHVIVSGTKGGILCVVDTEEDGDLIVRAMNAYEG